jgi:hypothetical protein
MRLKITIAVIEPANPPEDKYPRPRDVYTQETDREPAEASELIADIAGLVNGIMEAQTP